mgnify:CR=1 FL=1
MFLEILLGSAAIYAAKRLFSDDEEDKKNLALNQYSEIIYTKDSDFKYKELNYLKKKILACDSYIPIKQQKILKSEFEFLKKIDDKLNFEKDEIRLKYEELVRFYENFDKEIQFSHDKYTKNQIKKFSSIFNNNKKPYTFLQSRAIISEEENTLVVAGAGSGKTSTIIGKIYYSVNGPEKISPKDILLITYTKAVKEELKNKLNDIPGIEIHTMHSFGFKILKKNPNNLLKDIDKFSEFVELNLKSMFKDEKFKNKIEKYFTSYLEPYKDRFDKNFKNYNDYVNYMRKANVRKTLNDENVASFEEFEIANFLFLKGINYEYEKNYKYITSGEDSNGKWRKQYKPDFYLVDYDIYIEHFAINKNIQSPSWMDPGYVEDMEWKRKLHVEHNTKLIETYSYEKTEGILLSQLEMKLNSNGVKLINQSSDFLIKTFNENGQIKKLTKLLQPFLTQYKSNELNINQLKKRALTRGFLDMLRFRAFIEIFEFLLNKYQQQLAEDIDFVDMLVEARKKIPTLNKFNYRYIIIDEYQDISSSSFKFIKEIKNHSINSKVFAVGDDWQSIYKFLGSDLSYFNEFNEYLGDTDEILLKDTFRFHQSLADISTKFITKNKNQKLKEIISQNKITIKKPIRITMNTASYRGICDSSLDKITRELMRVLELKVLLKKQIEYFLKIKPESSIFVLSRNRRKKNLAIDEFISENYPNKKIFFKTIHGSKGLEADFVILLDVKSGYNSFPSEIEDDPLLKLVNDESSSEGISDPEERRLFYVAITRAKLKVHIIADEFEKSSFIEELSKYENVNVIKDIDINILSCDQCKSGSMILLTNSNDNSKFFACSNRPICDYKLKYSDELHSKYLINLSSPNGLEYPSMNKEELNLN